MPGRAAERTSVLIDPCPFPLMSYREAVAQAPVIKAVAQARYMPPWPADPAYRHFADENVLSEEEITLIGK
jgi:hypothetical protein